MRRNKREQELYKMVFNEHVHAVVLKRWPFHYHCGTWNKHKPDEQGRQYSIHLNRTRGVACEQITLIHELTHIRDDLEGVERSNAATEDVALRFCEENAEFVDYFWKRYVVKTQA